jgi:hypothetical protein
LPNLEKASINRDKLYEYALNPDHPSGRHKARVFSSVLGIERGHADVLAEIFKASLPRALAQQGPKTEHGASWVTYHEVVGLNGKAAIVTVAWIFQTEEPDEPKLVSCYIETENQVKLEQLLRRA